MKSVLRYTAVGLALATAGFASSASAATGSATATAEILSNLQVSSNGTVLNFGQITDDGPLAAVSTVVVSPLAAVTCGTDLICQGTPTVPTFTVTGFAGQTVAVSFPASSTLLTRSGGALGTMQYQMTVDALTTSANTLPLTGGTGAFTVGATLNVRPNQAPGVYTGAVAVRVEYN